MKGKTSKRRGEVKFLAVVPASVEAKLREEANEQRRSRQAQLVRVLEERYGLATDPVTANEGQLQPAAA